MKAVARAASFILAVFGAPLATASELPAPRMGEVYDRSMILRDGIDDFGMTLGQFVSCIQATREANLPPGDPLLSRLLELEVDGDTATLTLPGKSRDFDFLYVVKRGHVLMTEVRAPGVRITSFRDKFQVATTLAAACAAK